MTEPSSIRITVSVLTHNRHEVLGELLKEMGRVRRRDVEVIVVDNGSSDGTPEMVGERFPAVRLLRMPRNLGIEARNVGMINARGDIIVTIDDDILGIDDRSLAVIEDRFARNERLAGLCFQVRDAYTGRVCNWCHPYPEETHHDSEFPTTEISEGAVAFRKEILAETGMYPHAFFISHEGADLCARILDKGYEVVYTSEVVVRHKYAQGGRPGWRRYYYDTRNAFWLALGRFRPWMAARYMTTRALVMLVYSLRDGRFRYWLLAMGSVCVELPAILRRRAPIARETERRMRAINRNRPGVGYFLRKRWKQRQVRI